MRAKGDKDADIALLPPGGGWLMVEFGGESKEDADGQARRLMDAAARAQHPPAMKLYDDPRRGGGIWKVREGGLGSTALGARPCRTPGKAGRTPPCRRSRSASTCAISARCSTTTATRPPLYGHFGQGCVHCRIPFDLYTADGIRNYRSFMDEAADLVVRLRRLAVRASTATASRAASCCPRCSGRS